MRKLSIVTLLLCLLVLPGTSKAKDLYVWSDSEGDEGTKESPFCDGQTAIDAAASGDVIHVVQGTYHGKFKIGYWVIDKRGLTIVGGYKDKTFTERNPFKYPTFVYPPEQSKNTKIKGPEIRIKKTTGYADHWSTTVDGFWFDRSTQNGYVPLTEPIAKGPGNIAPPPLGVNSKPILLFEHPDCHIRNCVFMNSGLYAVRVTGDGSSIENNLFLNVNYCGIDIFGKGPRINKKGRFHKITIKNNTFVSAWNAHSLERAAGSFIIQNGGADVTISDNIFHLSAGNKASMGYAVKDERNFKADKWIHFLRNSVSQMRGGIASVYVTDLTASVSVEKVRDLRDTPWEVKANDTENPFFTFDKDWFDLYGKAIPKDDPSTKKVNMDNFNKMRRMMGLPLDAGNLNLGGCYLAWKYPLEHVKKGVFWKSSNEKLKGRGLNADGPFPVVKASLVKDGEGSEGAGAAASSDFAAGDFKEISSADLWAKGETFVDQKVKFKAYYMGKDSSFFAMGSGGTKIHYLEGADRKTHEIYKIRKVEAMGKKDWPFKGYVALGSPAMNYIKKNARRASTNKKKESDDSFIVFGIVKKSPKKINMGQGPQIVIDIKSITGE